jgi:membrane-bound lytic murein transglycosylase MltF
MHKFNTYQGFFKKYADQYNFNYLMVAAQGYQESRFDQDAKGPDGGVGVMQVIPRLAAANPIDIPNVTNANGNIHAGFYGESVLPRTSRCSDSCHLVLHLSRRGPGKSTSSRSAY